MSLEELYKKTLEDFKGEAGTLYEKSKEEITPILKDVAKALLLLQDSNEANRRIAKDMLEACRQSVKDVVDTLNAKLVFCSRAKIIDILLSFFSKVLISAI